MTTVDQLDLFEEDEQFGGYFSAEAKAARRREYRRTHKADYRRFNGPVPTKGVPFVIVPEIAPILEKLAGLCAKEACLEEKDDVKVGIGILAARAAVVLGKSEGSTLRRLYAVLNRKQLFVNANLVEACLMAMDAEHEFQYGEWPSRRDTALERVSIEAELAGKKVSPDKLLARANRLYDKGIRKALKRAVEVDI